MPLNLCLRSVKELARIGLQRLARQSLERFPQLLLSQGNPLQFLDICLSLLAQFSNLDLELFRFGLECR